MSTAAPRPGCAGDLHLENFSAASRATTASPILISTTSTSRTSPPAPWTLRFWPACKRGACSLGVTRLQAGPLGCAHRRLRRRPRQGKAAGSSGRWLVGLVRDPRRARPAERSAFSTTGTEPRGSTAIRCDGKKALPVRPCCVPTSKPSSPALPGPGPDPGFYRPLDVARRIAGTGSLGVERYIAPVEGKGSADGNYLLDLKEALPSSLAPGVPRPSRPGRRGEPRGHAAEAPPGDPLMAFLQAVQLRGSPASCAACSPAKDPGGAGRLERQAAPPPGSARHHGPGVRWARPAQRRAPGLGDRRRLRGFRQRRDWQGLSSSRLTPPPQWCWPTRQAHSAAFDAGYFA